MLLMPTNLCNIVKTDPDEENNEFQLHANVVCECGCDEFSLLYTGKEDFVQGFTDEIKKGIFSESDWVNAYDWITIEINCTKCGLSTEFVDYETA